MYLNYLHYYKQYNIITNLLLLLLLLINSNFIDAYNRKRSINERIINGISANPNEFPFEVLIQVMVTENESEICGGNLISNQWIVTAAHCLTTIAQQSPDIQTSNEPGKYPVDPNNMQILVGNEGIAQQTQVSVQQLIMHPNYNSNNITNDIGLIQLSTALNFVPGSIEPIKIYTGQLPNDQTLTAIGWGQTNNNSTQGIFPEFLKQVNLTYSNDPKVNSFCQSIRPGFTDSNSEVICIPTPNGKDTCQGDSGGGLLINLGDDYNDDVDENWVLLGVTSYGDTLNAKAKTVCASSDGAGFYTHVRSYLDFITSNTGLSQSDIVVSGSNNITSDSSSDTSESNNENSETTSFNNANNLLPRLTLLNLSLMIMVLFITFL